MRRWLARQMHRDRRWNTLGLALTHLGMTVILSNSFWGIYRNHQMRTELRATQDLLRQLERVEEDDDAERQRLLQQVNVRNAREQARVVELSARGLRVAQVGAAITVAGVVPMMIGAARKRRRDRWRKAGCCVECGYDLRESAERCPECGTESPV